MTRPTTLTVAMPTRNAVGVIEPTLDRLATAADAAGIDIAGLVVADDSTDDTPTRVRQCAAAHNWPATVIDDAGGLPTARTELIAAVDTEWFLFLDDDVRLTTDYLETVLAWTDCPRVGAVQGRKTSRGEPPADWVRRRARRGGTHATLVRTAAVADARIPDGLTVLEDEYLRRVVEDRGYRWVFEPAAWFAHLNQARHPIGFTEGFVGGRYGLQAFQTVAGNVPYALVTGRNPWPHCKRAVGWLAGRLSRAATRGRPAGHEEVAP